MIIFVATSGCTCCTWDQLPPGFGKKGTRLDVTPADETVGEIVNLNDLVITVSPSSGTVPDAIVDPVGYHVGTASRPLPAGAAAQPNAARESGCHWRQVLSRSS